MGIIEGGCDFDLSASTFLSSILFPFLLRHRSTMPGASRAKFAPSDGDIAQLARAMALQAIGRGFESHYLHLNAGTRERFRAVFFDN